MSNINSLEWTAPEGTEIFLETELSKDVYKIKYDGVSLTVRMAPPAKGEEEKGPIVELIKFPDTYGLHMRKLIGYVVTKLVPKYNGKG